MSYVDTMMAKVSLQCLPTINSTLGQRVACWNNYQRYYDVTMTAKSVSLLV